MRLSTFAFTILGCSAFANAFVEQNLVPRQRKESLLISPAAQVALPAPRSSLRFANGSYPIRNGTVGTARPLDLDNIQGDVLVGMKKNKELFFFFYINDTRAFKKYLASQIHPRITTTTQLLDLNLQPVTAVNVAFSQSGLTALGVNDNLGDSHFSNGQFAEHAELGDPGTDGWVEGLKGTRTHGVFLLASDTIANVNAELAIILGILGTSITETHRLQGAARPGSQEGHEHFGYMDGISQPAIDGFSTSVVPGQSLIQPGVFLFGEPGDFTPRPSWAFDGSLMAFRQLKQLVPEFAKFLLDNPLNVPGLTPAENSELLGARMIGRWKSGAPIDLTPLQDDPVLASDPNQNNDFTFEHPGEDLTSDQTRCPFSAHIRKTRPRADFSPEDQRTHILRAGIPYGPEVTKLEHSTNKTSPSPKLERGLAFVAYQASLAEGFITMQERWANNFNFIFGKSDPSPGVDPIIGVDSRPGFGFGTPRDISGLDPLDANHDITLKPDFVVSRGGEYFFVPTLSAILNPISI